MNAVDLIILGAGPAGLSAGIEAARAGAQVTLLDESVAPGGQIFRPFNYGFALKNPRILGHDYSRGLKLFSEFKSIGHHVTYLKNALVWNITGDNALSYTHDGKSFEARYRKLIIAAGAYDRPVPFPGWTLPGVFTAGGAQRLIKDSRVLPGASILLAGTGPMQMALGNQIAKAGGRVKAIVEASAIDNWWHLARAAWGRWALLMDAAGYFWGIRKSGIPLLRRHIIVEARGDGRVEEAIIAEVDRNWRIKDGTHKALRVDTICLGYGFIPSTELTRLAKCAHRYDPALRGWQPVRGETMETSVPGIFAAGDCTGIGGSLAAIEEGRIAGIAAARDLGLLIDSAALQKIRACHQRLRGLNRLRSELNKISVPRPGLFELADDRTVICRCEELTLGEIKKVVSEGITDMNEVKRLTRMGMGRCQGRICGPVMHEIIAREKGLAPNDIPYLKPRLPVKPIPLAALGNYRSIPERPMDNTSSTL
jgi:thioredoxin reductase/bacterioferritin-associated ferredoxin